MVCPASRKGLKNRSTRSLRPAQTPRMMPSSTTNAVAIRVIASVTIVSYQSPVAMTSARRKKTRMPTVRPARMKARSVMATSVSHHGEFARTPSRGFSPQTVNHWENPVVRKSRLLVIHSSMASAIAPT